MRKYFLGLVPNGRAFLMRIGQSGGRLGKQPHSAKGKLPMFRPLQHSFGEEDPSAGVQRVFRLLKISFCNIRLGLGEASQALA